MSLTLGWLEIGSIIGVLALATIVLIVTRRRHLQRSAENLAPNADEKKDSEKSLKLADIPPTASQVYISVNKEDVQRAEEDLRILSIEKEIASYALTRLYEAQAEGKITEKDKEKLLGKYKDEMKALEKQINDKQMVIRLHELEATQVDLVKLFQEKFEEINRNIESIRATLGVAPKPPPEPEPKKEEPQPPKEETKPPTTEAAEELKEKASPRPRSPPKSKAEERVEAIQQEVLKILERLEKQEAEG